VKQYGTVTAQTIPLRAFAEAGHLDSFSLHAGDSQGILKGSRLEDVASLSFDGVAFAPGKINSTMASDELPMVANDTKAAAALKQGATGSAEVALNDGRTMNVDAAVGDPRPGVEMIGKSVQASASSTGSNIELSNQDELPQDAKLRFSIRAQSPRSFSRSEQIEVATEDEAFSTNLSLDNGGLTLENSKVALATLDPAKAFGGSAFGPLKFRVIANGASGDWQPLATLVRLPVLQTLKCPAGADEQCRLSGSNLFLVDSVASDPQFSNSVAVPDGFPGYVLPVPRPQSGELYVKLRDDPSVVNQVTLAAEKLPPPPGEAATHHGPRPAYHGGEIPPAPAAGTSPAPGPSPSETSAAAQPSPSSEQKPATPPVPPLGVAPTPAQPPATAPQNQGAPNKTPVSPPSGGNAPSSSPGASSPSAQPQSGTSAPAQQASSSSAPQQ
jgi:hypothetical protein